MQLKPHYILCIILLLSACSGNQDTSTDTGSITFNMELVHTTTALSAALATSSDICSDYGITNINASVLNSTGAAVATDSWSCSSNEGTITDVPAGSNYTVRLRGTIAGGATVWRGEKNGINVSSGSATPAGTITMVYTGSDETLPFITSSSPAIDATGVPVTTVITAIFSEKMAASSVNTTNFTVKEGATPVIGSVIYDASTTMAKFIPSGILPYSTTYTATVTTDVEDMAANKLESDYSWNFTTEDPPPPDTLPDAPAGLIAASGYSQITITWYAAPAATSYNIYWSETSGVTKTTVTNITDITTTSYTHTGLTNGTIYYYVVTSLNSYGESIESNEISAAPGSTDTTPPTGSITINNKAVYTTSTSVTLSLSSSSTRGISQMCISNTTTCSSWEAYTTSKSWTLPTGDWTKFVFAWFKDSTGNSNTSPYFASITLDTTPPTNGTLTATAGDGQVLLSWSGFSDVTSGIGEYKLVYSTSNTPDTCSSGTNIYSGSDTFYSHTGLTTGTTYYYLVCALDNAGNTSTGSEASTAPN